MATLLSAYNAADNIYGRVNWSATGSLGIVGAQPNRSNWS